MSDLTPRQQPGQQPAAARTTVRTAAGSSEDNSQGSSQAPLNCEDATFKTYVRQPSPSAQETLRMPAHRQQARVSDLGLGRGAGGTCLVVLGLVVELPFLSRPV
ncbi:hypothetical protein PV733_08890 [Streptomyces europaeiscabiei]|uniref:hypothetical protein n=1 Tax=Streptomyces europaeiscabiei TaxID=146819 RepID=UPI0029ADCC85|nr:hypothetical protein [Streptomyces europaeiscabiei]MDX3668082.1 hypothetical protein [Streptomyces europaeiscabiei]MDX3709081.1 hypothetical protein [Streptomyces europaeiscabiei]